MTTRMQLIEALEDARERIARLEADRDRLEGELDAAISVAAEYLESSDANYDRAEKAEADRSRLAEAAERVVAQWEANKLETDPGAVLNLRDALASLAKPGGEKND